MGGLLEAEMESGWGVCVTSVANDTRASGGAARARLVRTIALFLAASVDAEEGTHSCFMAPAPRADWRAVGWKSCGIAAEAGP